MCILGGCGHGGCIHLFYRVCGCSIKIYINGKNDKACVVIIIVLRLIAWTTCAGVTPVMCGDSSATAGTVIGPVKDNGRRHEISSTWQITPQGLLIFWETCTQKLISLSLFNETASHDSCLHTCRNLISIFPRAHSCGVAFLIKLITINALLTTLSLRVDVKEDPFLANY